MVKENIFENAARKKIRFESDVGLINTEDLWDLPVESLDEIYKNLNKKKKVSSEGSLLKNRKSATESLIDTQIEIVKNIVETKLAEKEARETAAEKKAHNEKIMEIIERKQDAALEKKSIATLKSELDES